MTTPHPPVAGADEPSVPATKLLDHEDMIRYALVRQAGWTDAEAEESIDAVKSQAAAAEQERVRVLTEALTGTTGMLEYLWTASGLVDGFAVRDGFATGDPLHEDVPKVIAAARAAIEGKP